MKVVLVTGAPCAGKSTVAIELMHVACVGPGAYNTACLDGDHLGVYAPYNGLDLLDIITRNACACADCYAQVGTDLLFFAYVISDQPHLDSTRELFEQAGHECCAVGLVAEQATLQERWETKYGPDRLDDGAKRMLRVNDDCVRNLAGIQLFDTTNLDPLDSAIGVARMLQLLPRGVDKAHLLERLDVLAMTGER